MRMPVYRKRSRSALPLMMVVFLLTCSPGLSICTAIHHHLHNHHHAPDGSVDSVHPETEHAVHVSSSWSPDHCDVRHMADMECPDHNHRHITVPSILNRGVPGIPAPTPASADPDHFSGLRVAQPQPRKTITSHEQIVRITRFIRPVVLLI